MKKLCKIIRFVCLTWIFFLYMVAIFCTNLYDYFFPENIWTTRNMFWYEHIWWHITEYILGHGVLIRLDYGRILSIIKNLGRIKSITSILSELIKTINLLKFLTKGQSKIWIESSEILKFVEFLNFLVWKYWILKFWAKWLPFGHKLTNLTRFGKFDLLA